MKRTHTLIEVIAATCYLAGRGHDFATLFTEYQAYEDIQVIEDNHPITLTVFIQKMPAATLQKFGAELDELMEETLRALGYGEGVDIIDNSARWYA